MGVDPFEVFGQFDFNAKMEEVINKLFVVFMSFLGAFNEGLEKVMAHCPMMRMFYELTSTHVNKVHEHKNLMHAVAGKVVNHLVTKLMLLIFDINEALESIMAHNPLAQMFSQVTKNATLLN